jgi:hypothetical protein
VLHAPLTYKGGYEDEHNQVSNLRCSNRCDDYDPRDKSAGSDLQYRDATLEVWITVSVLAVTPLVLLIKHASRIFATS